LTEVENNGNFINIAALFDHEECGSESAQGAGSNIVLQSLSRIYKLLTSGKEVGADGFEKTIQRSFLISADMAHAVHPNYSEKHQSNHAVEINKGVVLKINYNQRYATDLVSSTLLKAIANKANVPIN
jgi:aspartyl aminopeptidase